MRVFTMGTTVLCKFVAAGTFTSAWLLFWCPSPFLVPTLAETAQGFDGIELMSPADNAAYHRQRMLDRHNYLRSREAENGFGGGAVFMNRLIYDVELEAYARNYARYLCATGKWEHSQRDPPLRVARGENLYTTTADYSDVSPRDFDSALIVQKWWDEREYFDWHSSHPSQNAANMGKMVGHWTQVVRAEASTMGCWIVTGCSCKGGYCGKQNGGRWSTYVACHYDYGNIGYYPYWPLNQNIQYRIPSSVSSGRRQRCGNCPKGFTACGTTIGGGEKRDAYLCVGYWQIQGALPPADLLRRSIELRRSSSGVPSWYYMVRNCRTKNGSCPSNSSCWAYNSGKTLTQEPRVLVNQCQCNGFSTRAGIYFERDFCGRYSMAQPYYDADAFLGFSELNAEPRTPDATASASESPAAVLAYNRELPTKLRQRFRGRSHHGTKFSDGYDSDILAPTPPLTEEAEEAADLLIRSGAAPSSAPITHHHGTESANVPSFGRDTPALWTRDPERTRDDVLLETDVTAVRAPSDGLMFEWRGVLSPLSIAQKPVIDADGGGRRIENDPQSRLQDISPHNAGKDSMRTERSASPTYTQEESEGNESNLVEPADPSDAQKLPSHAEGADSGSPSLSDEAGQGESDGNEPDLVEPADRSDDQDSTSHAEGADGENSPLSEEPEQHEEHVDHIRVPDGALENQSPGAAGAPVDVAAVRLDAENKKMTPLDFVTAASGSGDEDADSEPPERSGEEEEGAEKEEGHQEHKGEDAGEAGVAARSAAAAAA